jgi:virulence-associated protein VapD
MRRRVGYHQVLASIAFFLLVFLPASASAQAVLLSNISPNSLTPGMQVALTGSGFGNTQGSGFVELQNLDRVPVVSWSDTQIVVTVPLGTISGLAYISQNGTWSNGLPFSMTAANIAAISPNSLIPGMQVTLTGSGFGASQGSGFVELQNQDRIPVVSWSDTRIVVVVPQGTISGHAYILQNGTWSNGVPFGMSFANITAISPSGLTPGMQVALTGSGFGATQGSGFVELQNQDRVPVVSWSDTQIVVTVAPGTISGKAYISQNGTWSNGVPFIMTAANIAAVSPSTFTPGMQATLTGSGFGASQGNGFVELQNQDRVPVVSWSDHQIVVMVPQGTISGRAYVSQNGTWSNGVPFVMSIAHISAISPGSLTPGMQVTLTGSGFGATQGSGFVELQNVDHVPVVSWSDRQIVVTVPAGTISGGAYVSQYGNWSNGVPFVMTAPDIEAISPTRLTPGMQATLTGSGFGTTQGSGYVELQYLDRVPVVSWSDSQIVVTVPQGTMSGRAYISQYGTWSNGASFTMNATPSTLSANPVSFGNVQVGTSSTQPLTVTNAGQGAVNIAQASVTGSGFSLSGLTTPVTINSGQRLTLSVIFGPQSSGAASGSLSLVSDTSNANLMVALSGMGTPAGILTAAPQTSNLGNVVVGASQTVPATLTATGASVIVSSATTTSAEFTLAGVSFPLTLAAGQSVPFTLKFAPQATGAASANINFASNASNSPTIESLTGTGIVQPQHGVDLSWSPGVSPVAGYNLYRGSRSGGPYSKTNSALTTTTAFSDIAVQAGNTYYYVVTGVDSSGAESQFSNEVQAAIPTP